MNQQANSTRLTKGSLEALPQGRKPDENQLEPHRHEG